MAVGVIGAKYLPLTAMNVWRSVFPSIHGHEVAWRLDVGHVSLDRHAMRIRLEATVAVDVPNRAGPRFWRVRALGHVTQYFWIPVIERLVDAFASARGIVLNVPVADGERGLRPGVRHDQHAQIGERYV